MLTGLCTEAWAGHNFGEALEFRHQRVAELGEPLVIVSVQTTPGGSPRKPARRRATANSSGCAAGRRWALSPPMDDVVVAVCTRERPRELARLLDSLAVHAPHVPVIVVDNDPAGRARPTVDTALLEISYVHEPRVGIPQARNAALDAAPSQAAVAFVDDDETVEPGWLTALATARTATGAGLVTGPVRPRYDTAVPGWVRRGGFFERRTHLDRAELAFAATNNLLIAPEVREVGLRFDEQLALSGGSDAVFTVQARQQGFHIVWAADAVVTEHVPAERARAGWLCRRAYRVGITLGALATAEPAAPTGPAVLAAKSLAQIGAGGLVLMPWAAWQGRRGAVAALRLACRGLGGLVGLAGRRYEEYPAAR